MSLNEFIAIIDYGTEAEFNRFIVPMFTNFECFDDAPFNYELFFSSLPNAYNPELHGLVNYRGSDQYYYNFDNVDFNNFDIADVQFSIDIDLITELNNQFSQELGVALPEIPYRHPHIDIMSEKYADSDTEIYGAKLLYGLSRRQMSIKELSDTIFLLHCTVDLLNARWEANYETNDFFNYFHSTYDDFIDIHEL